ncbi:MAG: C40 family peptidase [Actinobacteria bacterium]|nr:C40 family peptidase [Actinomycetota bacterium]
MGLRLAALGALLVVVYAGPAAAGGSRVPDWAAPQIHDVVTRGLMGDSVATFAPNSPLTRQALALLGWRLQVKLTPPPTPAPATPPPTAPADTTTTSTDPTATTTTSTDPAATVPTTTTTATTVTTTTTPAPVVTTPAPTPPPPPPKVSDPAARVTMTELDAHLVSVLGLTGAAAEFQQKARAAGLRVPPRFGAEVVARLLGLRTNHPAAQDFLELLPNDPATRAEAAYSAAQIAGFGFLGNGWQIAAVQSLADSFQLPPFSSWQTRILDTAVARIGMPYVWGGTSDGPETDFGVWARGGYDCSGFVWRVYKLTPYAGERDLASVLRGRTTFVMSVEVPRSERIPFAKLQPADVIFFGAHGPRSSSAEVDHMAIYLGNGWFIQSSGQGVALATLTGDYRHEFAWGRRPLREAGLSG